jgi:uncharacterized protein YndB with AHSA1/START domain
MATIYHQVWMSAPVSRLYDTIVTPEAIGEWWAKQDVVKTGAGLVLQHSPGPEHGVVRLKVLQTVPGRRVEWECVSTHPPTSPASGWTGTRIAFDLSERTPPGWMVRGPGAVPMAVLDFRHSGWSDDQEYLGFCNFAWGEVLASLKRVAEGRPA